MRATVNGTVAGERSIEVEGGAIGLDSWDLVYHPGQATVPGRTFYFGMLPTDLETGETNTPPEPGKLVTFEGDPSTYLARQVWERVPPEAPGFKVSIIKLS